MIDPIEARLHLLIEKNADDYLELLRELIRVPSVLGDEGACQRLVADHMRDLKVFEREVYPENGEPFAPTGRDYGGRSCVVGRIPGAGSSHFILNAHVDTAPVEDASSWSHPPFAAEVDGNRLYGRGALDDKAGLAMLLLLARCFVEAGVRLPGDLIFESVIEDEDSGNGTLACTRAGYRADAALVLDGTWPLRIIDAHLGQLWLDLEVTGEPVAACVCRRAVSPLKVAQQAIAAVEEYVAEVDRAIPEWLGIREPAFCNVGYLRAGCWAGSVPERCVAQLQIGFAPPFTPSSMLTNLEPKLRSTGGERGISVRVAPGSLRTPPFANCDNPLVRTLLDTVRRRHPGEGEVFRQAVTGHCDLRHFQRPDGSPAAACLYGPGGGGNPHGRDEFYRIDHFVPVAQNVCSAILAWYEIT